MIVVIIRQSSIVLCKLPEPVLAFSACRPCPLIQPYLVNGRVMVTAISRVLTGMSRVVKARLGNMKVSGAYLSAV